MPMLPVICIHFKTFKANFSNKPLSNLYVINIFCHVNRLLVHYNNINIKKCSTEPVLIWPNIAIVEDLIFQEIVILARLKHIVSSEMLKYADKNVVISNVQMQMISDIPVLFGKWNSHANFIHISHMATNNPFLTDLHFVSTNQRTAYIWVLPSF